MTDGPSGPDTRPNGFGKIEADGEGLKAVVVTEADMHVWGQEGGNVGEGGASKKGRKLTDRGSDTSSVCLMFGFPGALQP